MIIDAQIEYNTKMIVIFSLLFYSLAMFLFTFWIEKKDPRWDENSEESMTSRLLLKRAYRWIGGAYIFIFLLMFLLMYRTVKLEILLQLVYGLYIPLFAALIFWGVMYSYDIILELTGVGKTRSKRRIRGKKR